MARALSQARQPVACPEVTARPLAEAPWTAWSSNVQTFPVDRVFRGPPGFQSMEIRRHATPDSHDNRPAPLHQVRKSGSFSSFGTKRSATPLLQ